MSGVCCVGLTATAVCSLPGRWLICRVAKPFLKTCLAELRFTDWNERVIAQLSTEVGRMRICYNLARIVACSKALANERIEAKSLWASYFNYSIERLSHCDLR